MIPTVKDIKAGVKSVGRRLSGEKGENGDVDFGWDTLVAALQAKGIIEADKAFQFIDTDGSGQISYQELLTSPQRRLHPRSPRHAMSCAT